MHRIPDEMLDLVAGGYTKTGDITNSGVGSTLGGWMPVVVIPPPPPDSEPSFGLLPGLYQPGIGGGSASAPASAPVSAPASVPVDYGPHHTSPIPAQPPKNVNMDDLRNTVLKAGDAIKSFDPKIEHGVIIVADPNGKLRIADISHGTATSVKADVLLNAGETVVAWIHSHPDIGSAAHFPSSPANAAHIAYADTSMAKELLSNPRVDPGAQLYIIDMASNDVYEYPATWTTGTAGNNISKDMQ